MADGVIPILCLVLTVSFAHNESHNRSAVEQKRVLLGDPGNIQQQLHSLELEIQYIKTKYTQHETNISQQETRLQSQETKLQEQEKKISGLTSQLQAQSIKIQNQESEIKNLKTFITNLSGQVANGSQGSTANDALDWNNLYSMGQNNSNSNATLVYSGFAAGTGFLNSGSSGLSLFLPPDPIWTNPEHSTHYGESRLYGTEYEFNLGSSHLLDNDMPCAVCMSKPGSEILMIPARNRCYDNWNEKYHGYLIGPHESHVTEDFLCLDEDPETVLGGAGDDNGHIFYLVKIHCGSLECPSYQDDKVVTCVCCSR